MRSSIGSCKRSLLSGRWVAVRDERCERPDVGLVVEIENPIDDGFDPPRFERSRLMTRVLPELGGRARTSPGSHIALPQGPTCRRTRSMSPAARPCDAMRLSAASTKA